MAVITTVTATGSRLKDLECEKCGNVYYYTITRTATGSREDGILTSQFEARDAAFAEASAALAWKLDREHDVVPCPTCRHVQAFLVDQERSRRADPYLTGVLLAALGFVCGVAGGVYFLTETLAVPNRRPTHGFVGPMACLLGAFGCVIGFLYFGMKWRAGRGFDPNANPLDFPRGLTTNQPMTRGQYEDSLRREAAAAIDVLSRPIPFGDAGGLDAWTTSQAVVRHAATELNDTNLARWADAQPTFAAPLAAAPDQPNPFQFT